MASQKLHKIDEKARFEHAYHAIAKCGERFSEITPHIPRCLDGVVRDIHASYNRALGYVFQACNSDYPDEKIVCLTKAHDLLFFQQSSLEYMVKAHGISIGQANMVIDCTSDAYIQCSKWKTYIIREAKSDQQ